VEVVWNVLASRAVSEAQRARLLEKLVTRIAESGDLIVVASDTRSQAQNRALAEERLAELIRRALVVPKVRKPTKPTHAAVRKRLEGKRRVSEKKRERRRGIDE
jgi:ribosome-associated protein